MKNLSVGMTKVIQSSFKGYSGTLSPSLFFVGKRPGENRVYFKIMEIGSSLYETSFILDATDIDQLIDTLAAAKEEMTNIEKGEK